MQFTNIRIGQRLSVAIGFTVLLILVLSLASYLTIGKLTDEWEQFHTVSLEKFVAVSKGNNKLGDAIHHFKNYGHLYKLPVKHSELSACWRCETLCPSAITSE